MFQIKDITVDLEQQVFVIYFNNPIKESSALSLKNYYFKYRDEKVIFRKVTVADDKIYLYPQLENKNLKKMFSEINDILKTEKQENIHEKVSEILTTKIEGVEDVDGNLVNEIRYKNYNQFREFFVQELNPKITVPYDTLFMNNNKPIFDDQPISKPRNFDGYWMNTPLKSLIE